MAAVVSVFDGVRVNSSDSNTNWGNWGSGGGAPSSEDQLAYQGTAVNTKHGGTALDGIDYDPGASPVNMLLASRRLWFAKVIVSDSFDLNATHGVNLALGQSQSVLIEYNMAGSGAARAVYDTYPPQGGYLITAIDPRIVAYRDSVTGTPDLSAVDWWGAQCAMIVGAAKGENLALDAIDIGRGWKLTRGDSTDADGEYQDFIDDDQGSDTAVPAGRVGVITSSGPGIMTIHGLLTIGESSTTTEFTDETGMVKLYPDGYHSAGSVGTVWNLGDASTVVTDTATEIGQGQKDADQDTRPDLIVEDTSGSATLDGKSITKARRVLYTNGVSAVGQALKECGQIDPTNSDYGGYQTLDGTGDYIDTSAAVSYTMTNGDAEIIARVKATDWTPAGNMTILDASSAAEGYVWLLTTTGTLRLTANALSTSTALTSSVIPASAAVNGEWLWLRVVYDASVASAAFFYSQDPANSAPEDIVWVAINTPTGTARAPGNANQKYDIGGQSSGSSLWTGDIAYVSMWDGTVADELQVFLADWRTGVDFTGGTPARPDGIQSVNWEENGNPVYTQGDDNTTAADLDGTSIADTTSYAALRWDVNADPDGELDNMTFDKGTGTSHAIEFGKNTPSSVTLRGQTYVGYNAANGNADSTFYNNTGGALTINLDGHTGNITYRDGVGATTTVVVSADYELTNIQPNTEITILDYDVAHLLISGGTSQDNVLGTASLERQGQSFEAASTGLIDRVRAQLKINGTPTDGVQARLLDKAPGIGTHVGHTVWDGSLENVVSSDSPAGSGDDLEIIAYARNFDWQGASADMILHHGDDDDATSENVRFYRASSTLNLSLADGAGGSVVLSSSSIASWPDDWRWVRVVYNHTTGVASFYYSLDPGDTARASVSWTALGTDSDTATANTGTHKLNIGATDTGVSWTSFWAGGIAYVAYWIDGNASTGDLLTEVDWRDKNTTSTVDEYVKTRTWTASSGIVMWHNQPWSNEILAADLTTSYQEVEFIFPTPIDVLVTVAHGVEFRRTGATHATNNYDIEGATTSQQADASRYDFNGTSWTEDATEDLYIELMEPASENELYHVEDEDTGSTTWQHDGTARTIEVLAMSLAYKQLVFLDVVGAANKSVPIQQQTDLVYSNP